MARAPLMADAEAYPEADRLAHTPHPRMTVRLYGHAVAERLLAEGLHRNRLHHGWLVSGAKGIGKATLAYRFARAALSRTDERDRQGHSLAVSSETTGSRLVRALSHPGLLVIRRAYSVKDKKFGASISVDDVRRLRQFLSMSAEPNSWRVVVVDDADDLNTAAANALLKSLEEPPPRTVFLLLSSTPGRLLPTIRSRCRVLALEPLGTVDLKAAVGQALEAEGGTPPTDSDWPMLARLGEGSVRRVLNLSNSGGLAIHRKIGSLLSKLPTVDWSAAHALADAVSPVAAEADYELFSELLSGELARLIRAQATGTGASEDVALAGRLIGAGRLATFAELWETLRREKTDADALNLDRRALILDTFARLERVCAQ